VFDYQIGDLLQTPFLFCIGGEKLFLEPPDGCSGSVAEIHHTPKAAVRVAGFEGEADLAIRRKQRFASGKSWDHTKSLS
jgi:hypothetical protein